MNESSGSFRNVAITLSSPTSPPDGFHNSRIFEIYPNMRHTLVEAGLRRPRDITNLLMTENPTRSQAGATVTVSNFLAMKGIHDGADPFKTTSVGKTVAQHIGEAATVRALTSEIPGVPALPAAEPAPPPRPAPPEVRATPAAPVKIEIKEGPPPVRVPVLAVQPAQQPAVEVPRQPAVAAVVAKPVPAAATSTGGFSNASSVTVRQAPPPPKPAPKRTEILSGPNYFTVIYAEKGINPSTEKRNVDITLTGELAAGGINSLGELTEKRKAGQRVLNVRNSTLKRLQVRAKELGINADLQVGLFSAGITTTEHVRPDALPARTATFLDVANVFANRPTREPAAADAPRSQPRKFASIDLANLSHEEDRALHHFVGRVSATQIGGNAINTRPVGGDINTTGFGQIPVSALVRVQFGQKERTAVLAENTLVNLGAIDRRAGTPRMTAEFISRFSETVDHYRRGEIASELARSTAPHEHSRR